MRVQHMIRAGSGIGAVALLVGLVSISGRQVFASGQAPAPAPALAAAAAQAVQQATAQPAAPAAGPARRLTVDEAVSMALESNLGIKADRLGPQIEDDAVAQARGVFAPNVFSGLTRNSNTQQTLSFTQALNPTFTNTGFTNTTGIQQRLPWAGGSYDIRWTGARSETTAYSNFNPQLSSSLTFAFQQPLLRNFSTDTNRRAVWNTENLRRIADLRLRQSIVSTTRTVRNAYWDLVGAMANLQVAQQSLDLARQSLKDNQTRVEVGTMAPIDIVEAQAEVARNEESVIVAQSLIENAQDNLRVLIMNPDLPDFWTTRFEPAETAELKPVAIDIDKAVTTALADRTDLLTAKRQLDNTQIDVHYYRNQRLPSVDLNLTYGLTGTGGTQFTFGDGYPPQIESQSVKGFGSVLGDVFHRAYPAWTARPPDRLPDRHEPGRRRPRRGAAPADPGPDQPAQPRAAGRRLGAERRPPGGDQPEAGRGDPEGARAGRAAPRGRAEEVQRGPDVLVHRLPGAARPRHRAVQRAGRHHRLQQVARELRGGAGDAAAVERSAVRGQRSGRACSAVTRQR